MPYPKKYKAQLKEKLIKVLQQSCDESPDGACHKTTPELADAILVSVRTAATYLNELKKEGLISVLTSKATPSSSGGYFRQRKIQMAGPLGKYSFPVVEIPWTEDLSVRRVSDGKYINLPSEPRSPPFDFENDRTVRQVSSTPKSLDGDHEEMLEALKAAEIQSVKLKEAHRKRWTIAANPDLVALSEEPAFVTEKFDLFGFVTNTMGEGENDGSELPQS